MVSVGEECACDQNPFLVSGGRQLVKYKLNISNVEMNQYQYHYHYQYMYTCISKYQYQYIYISVFSISNLQSKACNYIILHSQTTIFYIGMGKR